MTIEVVKGTAAVVRHAVHVSGDRDGVSTKHHATFRVGETTVVFASGALAPVGQRAGGGR